MTKLNLPLISQNDPKWKDILLGYNTKPPYTIGNYGCLITSLCMYLTAIGKPETPETINSKLKDAGGFKSGSGEMIWSVFNKTFGVTEQYISPRYSGPLTSQAYAKINELLDAKMPVLAEIDFNPSQQGEQMHFVEIIGYDDQKNYYANDPWSGTQINMNVYGSMDLSVYQFRAYKTPVPADATPDEHYFADAFRSLCNIMRIPVNKETAEREVNKFIGYEDQLRQQDELLKQKDAQVIAVKTEAGTLREQVKQLTETNKQLTETNVQMKQDLAKHDEEIITEQHKISEIEARIAELEKIQPIEAYSGVELIGIGIKKLFHIS